MKRTIYFSLAMFLGFAVTIQATVNKSIQIGSGSTISHALSSVNGSIRVGDNCAIQGSCSTVNGRIELGNQTRTNDVSSVNGSIRIGAESVLSGEASSVNGSIRIGEAVQVKKGMHTVNGGISCEAGTQISLGLKTVNGRISLNRTVIDGDLTTVNGDIELADHSVIDGSIHIKRKRQFSLFRMFSPMRTLHIRLSRGSQVNGDINVETENMKVVVHIAPDCEVKGKIRNAEVIRESL